MQKPSCVHTALKSLMQKVLERLMGAGVSVEDDEEDASMSLSQKRVSCSMTALCQWYKTVTKVSIHFR